MSSTQPANSQTTAPTNFNTILVIDPEITRENPVEAKHIRLGRNHRSGPLDRDLKPDANIRDDLNVILEKLEL